ncbi:hypothetical protein FOL47_004807 [Perkinsus chesapeaki]|uniref:N-acetyltransferase domain-containing protein n=1 Tax=Perkinsus chesapeaki TaxID=330153 RepID=A0A7J6M0W6_PERCH|nr:hypothetical protein FOL47_004807 [Perkinsus chesapeaki]
MPSHGMKIVIGATLLVTTQSATSRQSAFHPLAEALEYRPAEPSDGVLDWALDDEVTFLAINSSAEEGHVSKWEDPKRGSRAASGAPCRGTLTSQGYSRELKSRLRSMNALYDISTLSASQKIVGSAEFGMVRTMKHGEWAYITSIFVNDKYRGNRIAPKLLNRLVGYIHYKRPLTIAAWTRTLMGNNAARKAFLKAGFVDKGKIGDSHYLIYIFSPTTHSTTAFQGDDDSIPYLTSPRVTRFFEDFLLNGIVDEVYSRVMAMSS